MSNLSTIKNTRCFIDDNGTAQLNLEDVARGLGFTEIAGSGNETVRWRTIKGYLEGFGFIATSCDTYSPQVGKETFIPENIFYRLAMKAKNETAEKFQAIVADEILPAIRKTGTYSASPQIPQTLPEALRAYANEVENHIKAKALIEENKPLVLFANSVAGSDNLSSVNQLSKILNQNGVDIGEKRLFVWLREHGYLCKCGDDYNLPTQRSMDLNIMEIKKSSIITGKGDTLVTRTTKITGKGCIYFVNKFLNVGKLEVV
jgi:phage antirepressor YoqD-like protein